MPDPNFVRRGKSGGWSVKQFQEKPLCSHTRVTLIGVNGREPFTIIDLKDQSD
jgi:hypothetical protein